MAYTRREVTDGVTVMNKDLYDNLQDGIEEAMRLSAMGTNSVLDATVEEDNTTE